jgi:hypothetical protein
MLLFDMHTIRECTMHREPLLAASIIAKAA